MSKSPLISLDIVVPSFRADVKVLKSIRNLVCPKDMNRRMIIVLDDPSHPVPEQLKTWNYHDTTIVTNSVNLGANGSRNRGIEESTSDWILFLDDDIEPQPNLLNVYAEAIRERGEKVPGFVGVTRFPKPKNNFTAGLVASDILTFFDLAEHKEKMSWGITANLMVKREALAEHRFRSCFPKGGGGEDIDICLEIVNSYGTEFATEPNAVVHHPWWNNGERTYRRFFRWAYGDSNLPALHPQHRWRNLPNTAELLTVCFIIVYLFYMVDESFPKMMLLAISGIIAGDFFSEWLRLLVGKRIANPIIAIESSCVRFSNDLGRVKAVVQSLKPWRITERFDYAATGEWIWGERKWAFTRFCLQTVVALSLIDLLM